MKQPKYLKPSPDDTIFDRYCKWCFQSYENMIVGVLAVGSFITLVAVIVMFVAMRMLPPPAENVAEVTTTTIATTTTTTVLTTTVTTTVTTVTTTTTEVTTTTTYYDFKERLIDYGTFRGTYYHGRYTNPCPGGSGRMLEDCTPKEDEIKGSVACRRIQEDYNYWVNGRTKVYLEVKENPEMDGWYWVDDACESYSVVDFYFINYDDCPWHGDLNRTVHLWMEIS